MRLTNEQLSAMGYTEKSNGVWVKGGKVVMRAPQSTTGGPTSHSVVQKVSEQPKSPEDRLNKTEREFLGRLRSGVYGQMNHIGIQSVTLQIGFDTRYTPDFFTYEDHISGIYYTFWEVKGFMRDDARVKLYTAARMYPFWIFFLVQKVKGEWKQTVIHQ